LAGGNTDAARQISELANPNVKMTKDAILNVVNQLSGINRMKIARADYLAPYANNPEEYSKKSQLFNKFADYRLFQELNEAEVKKMKKAMSPAERDEISKKIKEAQMAGIIK
jgi:SLT domain-containing protein